MVVHQEARDVRNRLAELGLEEEPLQDVVRQGYLGHASCTPNHPPQMPGMWAWAEAVRALREYLIPLGWETSNDNNYALTVHPAKRLAIAVATGNDGTGQATASPSTKSAKGPSTIEAIATNQMQFPFMDADSIRAAASLPALNGARVTWFLLVHWGIDELRCELSLPSSIADDGHINGWHERILLGSIPIDGDLQDIVPPSQADIDVDVRRRA